MTDDFLYLDADGVPFLAAFHPAASPAGRAAVLLIPPFAWEDVASHRARREWARFLAARNHPVLRLDLPGTADSAGDPNDAGTLERWNAAIATAADWLGAETAAPSITAIGIGLGGVLAYLAAVSGHVDDLVLWASPARGRSLVREIATFSAHETSRIVEAGAPAPPALPVGMLAPSGYVLAAETVEALNRLDLAALPLPSSARVLLLGRGGINPDRMLAEAVVAAGADLAVDDGVGYAEMLTDPDQARSPMRVFELVGAWMSEEQSPPRPARSSVARPAATRALETAIVRERPFRIPLPDEGEIVGILAEPVTTTQAPAPLTAVFLNAGAIRRIGPHRMWVDAARRFVGLGVPSLRVDLEGIGDADGEERMFADVGRFYDERFAAQVSIGLDALEAAGFGNRFVLIGLCSGAAWAFQTALADDRVASAVMINPRMLFWDQEVQIARELRRTRLLVRPVVWKRILRGDVASHRWSALVSWVGRGPQRLVGRLGTGTVKPKAPQLIEEGFDRVRGRDLRLRFLFCGGEPLFDELKREGLFGQPERWPNISMHQVPGRDHTLRPLWMHEHVDALLDGALRSELSRAQEP